MEAEAALIRSDRVIELHAKRAVDLHVPGIVHPGHTENDDAVRFGQPFENARLLIGRSFQDERHERVGYFPDRLVEFRLAGIAGFEPRHELPHCILVRLGGHPGSPPRLM